MKVLLVSALLLLLCSTQVLALRCYTCEDGDCKTATDCPPSSYFCKQVMQGGDIISRTCEPTCAVTEEGISCCQTDLC